MSNANVHWRRMQLSIKRTSSFAALKVTSNLSIRNTMGVLLEKISHGKLSTLDSEMFKLTLKIKCYEVRTTNNNHIFKRNLIMVYLILSYTSKIIIINIITKIEFILFMIYIHLWLLVCIISSDIQFQHTEVHFSFKHCFF